MIPPMVPSSGAPRIAPTEYPSQPAVRDGIEPRAPAMPVNTPTATPQAMMPRAKEGVSRAAITVPWQAGRTLSRAQGAQRGADEAECDPHGERDHADESAAHVAYEYVQDKTT
jgi:hypothetical protein